MAQRLGRMDQYRTPPFALTQPRRRAMGVRRPVGRRPQRPAMPTGAGYLATALPLQRPDPANRLSGAARRAFERQYANVEIADSVAMMGGHQVGLMRAYHDELSGPSRRSSRTF